MREILFRGKRTDNGKWIEGRVFRLSEDQPPFIMMVNRHGESHEVMAETVCQYTGLSDKNGKKIFGGDIVERYWGAYGIINFRIDFVSGEFLAVPVEKRVDTWAIRIPGESENLEVIGNIHDNPELLGGADNGK